MQGAWCKPFLEKNKIKLNIFHLSLLTPFRKPWADLFFLHLPQLLGPYQGSRTWGQINGRDVHHMLDNGACSTRWKAYRSQ